MFWPHLPKSISRKWVRTSGWKKIFLGFPGKSTSSQLIEIWQTCDKRAVSDRICKSDEAKWIFAWSVQTEKLNIRKINASPENLSCFPADVSMKQNTNSILFKDSFFFLFSSMTLYRDHQDSMRCCSINILNLL